MTKIFVIAAVILGASGVAHAREHTVAIVNGTLMTPIGEKGDVADSYGAGAEARVFENDECWSISLGGFYAMGDRRDGKEARDVYDFHFDVDLKASSSRSLPRAMPFIGVGLNVLNVATTEVDGDRFHGTTLGMNARAGIEGFLSRKLFYSVSATYLGANVPGTGDDLGGLVLQAGIGWAMEI
jgi:hypothetical protein